MWVYHYSITFENILDGDNFGILYYYGYDPSNEIDLNIFKDE